MNSKKAFLLLLFLLGETIIIVSFLHFGNELEPQVQALNIVVTSIIFNLYFLDHAFPWMDIRDKSGSVLASLGIKWQFSLLYSILSIIAIVAFLFYFPAQFVTQLLVHGAFVFILLGSYFLGDTAATQAKEVYNEEQNNRSGIDAVRKAAGEVHHKMLKQQQLPRDLTARMEMFTEELRYVSPTASPHAVEIEKELLQEIEELRTCLFAEQVNPDKVMAHLQNCNISLTARKNIYKN